MTKDKKIYFLTDIHFGVRNASDEWLMNQMSYFNDFFIPFVKADNVKEKYLFIGGDLFDNRQSINIRILHSVIQLFKDLSKIFKEIHIILGNHDISNKTTNDINVVSILGLLDNITVYKDPNIYTIGNSSFLFLPWANHNENIYLQEYQNVDYVLMHTDINTLRFNKYTQINDGVEIIYLSKFKKVFSGHIHYGQEKDNVIMLGSPYHMTRNDINNKKYVYTLDPYTHEIEKIENNFSPEFKEIDFNDLIEMTLPEANEYFRNNYVYIKISNLISFENGINIILEQLSNAKNIKIVYYDDLANITNDVDITLNQNLSIDEYIKEFVDALNQPDEIKESIQRIIHNYTLELDEEY